MKIILLNSPAMPTTGSCSYFILALKSSSSFKSGPICCSFPQFWLLFCSICSPYCRQGSLLLSFGSFYRFCSLIEVPCSSKFDYFIRLSCQISIDVSVRNRKSPHSMDSFQCFEMIFGTLFLNRALATLQSISLSAQSQGIGEA